MHRIRREGKPFAVGIPSVIVCQGFQFVAGTTLREGILNAAHRFAGERFDVEHMHPDSTECWYQFGGTHTQSGRGELKPFRPYCVVPRAWSCKRGRTLPSSITSSKTAPLFTSATHSRASPSTSAHLHASSSAFTSSSTTTSQQRRSRIPSQPLRSGLGGLLLARSLNTSPRAVSAEASDWLSSESTDERRLTSPPRKVRSGHRLVRRRPSPLHMRESDDEHCSTTLSQIGQEECFSAHVPTAFDSGEDSGGGSGSGTSEHYHRAHLGEPHHGSSDEQDEQDEQDEREQASSTSDWLHCTTRQRVLSDSNPDGAGAENDEDTLDVYMPLNPLSAPIPLRPLSGEFASVVGVANAALNSLVPPCGTDANVIPSSQALFSSAVPTTARASGAHAPTAVLAELNHGFAIAELPSSSGTDEGGERANNHNHTVVTGGGGEHTDPLVVAIGKDAQHTEHSGHLTTAEDNAATGGLPPTVNGVQTGERHEVASPIGAPLAAASPVHLASVTNTGGLKCVGSPLSGAPLASVFGQSAAASQRPPSPSMPRRGTEEETAGEGSFPAKIETYKLKMVVLSWGRDASALYDVQPACRKHPSWSMEPEAPGETLTLDHCLEKFSAHEVLSKHDTW
jgi:hypothetical protein